MSFYVYAYFNPLKKSDLHECGFEPFYVGKGSVANNRAHDHLKETYWKKDPNRLKINILKKIKVAGLEPLIIILEHFDDERLAFSMESDLIAEWGRRDLKLGPLSNLTDGGEGPKGRIMSEETREKIRIAATGQTASPETRAKMSAARKGKPMNPEAVRKSAESRTGLKHKPESLQKMRDSHAALKADPIRGEQWRERQRAAQTGTTRSTETKSAMKESSPRSTPLMLDGVRYPSLNEAVKQTGLSRTVIRRHPTFQLLENPKSEAYQQVIANKLPIEISIEEQRARAAKHKRVHHIMLMGVEYFSIAQATKATGLSKHLVITHPTYIRLNA